MPAPDIAVVGAGIVGLWTAYYAAQTGAQVLLLDKGKIGGGASDGILGALMPHQPIHWNDKKQFQLDGLMSLPGEIAQLEALTGIDCGYFRCGRIMPITNAEKRRQSLTWAKGGADVLAKAVEWNVINR
ncbi:MAG: FAD-dependent oxidoreductase [Ahrensia sp.]|nr:FAD-dependent oxidoreductase [Ahrensia sp.]